VGVSFWICYDESQLGSWTLAAGCFGCDFVLGQLYCFVVLVSLEMCFGVCLRGFWSLAASFGGSPGLGHHCYFFVVLFELYFGMSWLG
jgi:hypothetical protein